MGCPQVTISAEHTEYCMKVFNMIKLKQKWRQHLLHMYYLCHKINIQGYISFVYDSHAISNNLCADHAWSCNNNHWHFAWLLDPEEILSEEQFEGDGQFCLLLLDKRKNYVVLG